MFRFIVICLVLFFSNNPLYASQPPQEILKSLINAKLMGEYNLKVMGLNIYNIKLWAENEKFSYDKKFAIEINYKMNFSKENLAKRSIEEISKIQKITDQNELIVYQREFLKIFLDVKKGDCKVAIFTPQKGVELFFNHQLVGTINDLKLARYFVDIWLSKNSSYPKMTTSILGEKNDY